ncbi:MAG: uridine kinase [Muribaculaceae bacterium]|nr:uridine kinase [Muribaculaceae bacterium]
MIIIGIAGGTGSGKTTVVRKIMERLPFGQVGIISQDNYYKDSSHIPMEERQNINFDEPAAFDWDLLIKHIHELKQGKTIQMPTYSYITSSRNAETIPLGPHHVVVIEGILVLSDKRLRDLMDIKVFVDADGDDRLIRVISRDCVERGRTPESVIDRYQKVLKPMHLLHIEPAKRYASIIVPEGGHNEVAINLITDYIKGKLAEQK